METDKQLSEKELYGSQAKLYTPRFISVEGLSCTGKTTLCKRLVAEYERNGIACVYLKLLPSQTPRGDSIKAMPSSTPSIEIDRMYLSDFYQSIEEAQQQIRDGKTVITDRYLPSLMSYCKKYRKEEDLRTLESELDPSRIIIPDILFLLSADLDTRKKRALTKKDMSRFDRDSLKGNHLWDYMKEYSRMFNPIEIKTDDLDEKGVLETCLSYIASSKEVPLDERI